MTPPPQAYWARWAWDGHPVTCSRQPPAPCIPVSHTNNTILSMCHLRKKIRKHCFENGRRPPKDPVQEGELVAPRFSALSPSCQHGAQTAGTLGGDDEGCTGAVAMGWSPRRHTRRKRGKIRGWLPGAPRCGQVIDAGARLQRKGLTGDLFLLITHL